MKSTLLFLVSITVSVFFAAPFARASCDDRPGTPDLVKADPDGTDRLRFSWRNTTGRRSPDNVHNMYFDIHIRDGAGKIVEQRVGIGPFNVTYHGWSSTDVSGLAPDSTRCFVIAARTGRGTQGCLSQVFSGQVCARTPTVEIDKTCKAFAKKAHEQVMAISHKERTGLCRDWPTQSRWSSDQAFHYSWCVAERQAGRNTQITEQKARDDILASCKSKTVAAAPAQPATPAPAPASPAGSQCKAAVWMTLDKCTNVDGSDMTNWDYRGYSPVCGRGADEEEAKRNGMALYAQRNSIIVKDNPGPNECGYTSARTSCNCEAPTTSLSARMVSIAPATPAFLYGVAADGTLRWYRHNGAADGSFAWAQDKQIGTGWRPGFKRIVPDSNGVIYGITEDGSLRWHRHLDFANGSPKWAEAKIIGTGWGGFKHVFSGGNGVLYAVTETGDLLWHRYAHPRTGTTGPKAWRGPIQVGNGWQTFIHLFAGGEGVIYGVLPDGTLRWHRHLGWSTGAVSWTAHRDITKGWHEYKAVFSANNGVLYAVAQNGDLLWFKHKNFLDTPPAPGVRRLGKQTQWSGPNKVGNGWGGFIAIFAAL